MGCNSKKQGDPLQSNGNYLVQGLLWFLRGLITFRESSTHFLHLLWIPYILNLEISVAKGRKPDDYKCLLTIMPVMIWFLFWTEMEKIAEKKTLTLQEGRLCATQDNLSFSLHSSRTTFWGEKKENQTITWLIFAVQCSGSLTFGLNMNWLPSGYQQLMSAGAWSMFLFSSAACNGLTLVPITDIKPVLACYGAFSYCSSSGSHHTSRKHCGAYFQPNGIYAA